MLKKLLLTLTLLATAVGLRAQVVTTEPSPLQEDATDAIIYFHADQGNKGLMGLTSSTPVYAHTGVLTDKSTSDSDWKYAPTWGDNAQKYRLEYVSTNLWKLVIGNIRTYYGVPANETIKKLAFVFRNTDGSKEGKTAAGGDILVDVSASGLQVSMTTDFEGSVVTPENPTVTFTITSTLPARLSLGINGVEVAYKDNATQLVTKYTFTEQGNYNCYGNAKDSDGKTVSTKLVLAFANASPKKDYPGGVPKQGAVRQADGSVIFCLAAPEKTSAMLVGSWNDYTVDDQYQMNRQDYQGQRYFWVSVSGLDPDTMYPYYYLVDANKSVGDPYAKLILDPSNDKYIPKTVFPDLPDYPTGKVRDVQLAVYWENINEYDWQVKNFRIPDHSNLIIYELLLRDFTGTEGQSRGNGTVRQAIEKLPYLKSLGVNCIELLPINEFNGNNSWGYNPNFYFAPDKAYGTPDDYKEFIDLCHQNGIAVVLDMVFNQSDWQHPWYRLYEVGENPMYNATAPHAYSVLNDWNQGHPLVRQQWYDCVRYWMEEYKVDGYRFDLVKGLGNNDSYANSGDSGTNAFNQSRIDNMRAIQEVMLQVNPKAIFINENLAGYQEENAMAAFGQQNWANINDPGGQFAMGYSSNSNCNRFYAPQDNRTWGSTVSYLESHDEERLAYKQNQWGAAGVKGDLAVSMRRLGSAAAQMILAPGAHMIWMFSELGNDQTTKDAQGGNNTSPKKVLWSYLDQPDRRGLYDNYSQLIALRMNEPNLFAENTSLTLACNSSNWNNGRTIFLSNGGKEAYLVVNPNISKEITVSVPFTKTSDANYYVYSASYGTTPTYSVAAGNVTVPANSYAVICTKNVKESAVDDILDDAAPADFSLSEADAVYTLDGRRVANPSAPGLYIAVKSGKAKKVLVK